MSDRIDVKKGTPTPQKPTEKMMPVVADIAGDPVLKPAEMATLVNLGKSPDAYVALEVPVMQMNVGLDANGFVVLQTVSVIPWNVLAEAPSRLGLNSRAYQEQFIMGLGISRVASRVLIPKDKLRPPDVAPEFANTRLEGLAAVVKPEEES